MKSTHSLLLHWCALAIAAIAVVAAGGCEALDPNPGPTPVGTGQPQALPEESGPPTAQRGAKLYAQTCAPCHGTNAEGSAIWQPPIQGRVGITDIVRNGRRAMPAFKELSDNAIASIELFLQSFPIDFGSKSNAELYTIFCSGCHGDSGSGSSVFAGNIQGYQGIAPIVRNGRGDMPPVQIADSLIERIQAFLSTYEVDLAKLDGVTYYARVCAGCHGAQGEGSKRGYEIRNPVRDYATYVVRNGRTGLPDFKEAMPAYDQQALSDQQLSEMLTWLRTASKPPTGKLLYNRFCAACHAIDGSGGVSEKIITGKAVDSFEDAIRIGKGGKDFTLRNKYMPSWSIDEITDQEIRLMATYVRSLR